MANRDGRNQAPTPKRQRQARRDGRLPRSPELSPAAALIAMVAVGSSLVPKLLRTVHAELLRSLSDLGDGRTLAKGRILSSVSHVAVSALPLMLVGGAVGITTTLAQGGIVKSEVRVGGQSTSDFGGAQLQSIGV